MKNQKDKLNEMIKELGESIDSNIAKKINFQQLDRISRRLLKYYDECEECKEYTDLIIKYIEVKKFIDLDIKELQSFNRDIKAIISHMQKKHKLTIDGYYMSICMSIGLAIGAGLGSALKNIALGISLGMLVGVVVGVVVDADYKKKGLTL